MISRAVSFPPDQLGNRISAGLPSVPGRRALSSLVGPRAADKQVLNNTSLIRLCLAILSPPHPQETAWSPAGSESIGQDVHFPSVGNTFTPNLYFTAVMNSSGCRCNPSVGDGTTFSQAPELGSPKDPILALSLMLLEAVMLVTKFQ